MGKIYNKFSKFELKSESSVEQKFIYPFLTDFLGYHANDIVPQKARGFFSKNSVSQIELINLAKASMYC